MSNSAWADDSDSDIDEVWEVADCPVCASEDTKLVKKDNISLLQFWTCKSCAHCFEVQE